MPYLLQHVTHHRVILIITNASCATVVGFRPFFRRRRLFLRHASFYADKPTTPHTSFLPPGGQPSLLLAVTPPPPPRQWKSRGALDEGLLTRDKNRLTRDGRRGTRDRRRGTRDEKDKGRKMFEKGNGNSRHIFAASSNNETFF